MNVDVIADAHLKPYGRALPPDDEMHLVAKLIDAKVREYLGDTGADKAPAPLCENDIKMVAEVAAKAAFEAVATQMEDLRHQLEIMNDNIAFMRNILCRIDGERMKEEKTHPKRRFWR